MHGLWGQKLRQEEATGSPTMVLAVRASKARAAPPGHGGQHLLLDLVHRLVGHAVPGGRQPAQRPWDEPGEELD